jgi:hypothetical protein
MARTFNESKAVFLAGPIEWWWSTPEDPNRFDSEDAVAYRHHRVRVRDIFVEHGFLVYSPHAAFKGDWNEKMQPVNDYVLSLSDIVIDMTPRHIKHLVANGTDHEVSLALRLRKAYFPIPPSTSDGEIEETAKWILNHPVTAYI